MHNQISHSYEDQVAKAFSSQSAIFDKLYEEDLIIQYKRERVRAHLLKLLKQGSTILELNAGTGEDAVYLAERGFPVHAIDISPGMQRELEKKITDRNLSGSVTYEKCSFTKLEELKNKGPYDCIFSNFAGLNCTGDLKKVLGSFEPLLNPEGIVVLVILPGFCLWEILFLLRGKFKTATRRFFSSKGRLAFVEGIPFLCWYYSPGFLKQFVRDKYFQFETEGLCTIVPPSYVEKFAEKHRLWFRRLSALENRFKNRWPWKNIGDYYIISFRKKSGV